MSRNLVVFRYPAEQRANGADVRGEMSFWTDPNAMQKVDAEWLEHAMHVPTGVYEYKFKLSATKWALDPHNPRTRARDGMRNNVLVVDGTPEPVLHAPTAPWVTALPDGRVCVRACLRRGAGDGLELRWDEGVGLQHTAMRLVGDEDEHLLFEAMVPGSRRSLEYLFALTDGTLVGATGGVGQLLSVSLPGLRPTTPAWWQDAVLYSIFVDRFRRGGAHGAWPTGTDPARDHRAGGDLFGVIEALPYLEELGVTAIHLTPVCEAASVHRYDCVEPRAVAPELGGDDALDRLFEAAHARGLRVIMDMTVTHVHRDFFAFRHVRERGQWSRYWDWFHIYAYPFGEGQRPGYRHYQKGQWQEPLLRTDNPEVMDYLVGTFEQWARRGADGFRIDACADVPVELSKRIRDAVRAINPEAVVFGEVIPDNIERWTGSAIDAATDFVQQQAVYDWLWREDATADRVALVAQRRRFSRGGPGWSSIAFTATHDQPRLRTLTQDAKAARLGHLLSLTGAAVPMLYYGDEVGLASDAPERAFEDAWPDRQCMPWQAEDWDDDTLRLVRGAIALRRSQPALRRGDEHYFEASGDALGVRRAWRDEVVDVVVHRGSGEQVVLLPEVPGKVPALLMAVGDAHLGPDGDAVCLGAAAGAVIGYVDPAPDERDALLAHNARLCRAAFEQRLLACPALPARLYLTVTEACNLRCAHCITEAPARTRDGRARTMRPWVVEALADAFRAADYVAFTHGGESLVAPIFFDVLAAIARARGDRPRPDVHLVTNGMLLDDAMARRLIAGGVTSIMVSLDGASAATNDSIRIGGRFDKVVDNVRQTLRVRDELGADLRLGLSTVVGHANLTELPHVGELARSLRVDWLKVEEAYPINSFARRLALAPDEPRLDAAMAELRDVLATSEVVLVDHLDPPSGCTCGPVVEPALREFRVADDYANRARLAPCRAAWEQACIDPDGTVRPVDYAHPSLGSLLDAPLLNLWNGHVAQDVRGRVLAAHHTNGTSGRRDAG